MTGKGAVSSAKERPVDGRAGLQLKIERGAFGEGKGEGSKGGANGRGEAGAGGEGGRLDAEDECFVGAVGQKFSELAE